MLTTSSDKDAEKKHADELNQLFKTLFELFAEKKRLTNPTSNVFERDNGISEAIKQIRNIASHHHPVIVAIAGGSASGKTFAVSKKIKEAFQPESIIISMDDYYYGVGFMESESKKGNTLNWDQPEAVNVPLFIEHLKLLRQGSSIKKPVYDFKTGESHSFEEIHPKKIIIYEGLFSLVPEVAKHADFCIYVDIGAHGRIIRRLLRDVKRTGQKPKDIINYFTSVVNPMHEKYVDSTKKNAHIIIMNEYDPKVESQNSGLHEVQTKFRIGQSTIQRLNASGVRFLSKSHQTDYYYNPKDRDFTKTDELLRIREDQGKIILTYKGPKTPFFLFRKRAVFEFQIDAETKESLLSIYPHEIKIIEKDRTFLEFDGIKFTLDTVISKTGMATKNLGTFLEIRELEGSSKLSTGLLILLGLNLKDKINDAYIDM